MHFKLKGDEAIPEADLRFIRAITVEAPPQQVWPWVAQIGRGAGYYSYDLLDNGRRPSADHLLEVPPPSAGDNNAAIGQVTSIEPGNDIVWLVTGVNFVGATCSLVIGYSVLPLEENSLTRRDADLESRARPYRLAGQASVRDHGLRHGEGAASRSEVAGRDLRRRARTGGRAPVVLELQAISTMAIVFMDGP